MNRNYTIIQYHMEWGIEGNMLVTHAIVAGRLAASSLDVSWRTCSIYHSYQEYLDECKKFGIYSCKEEKFNQYMNPQ